MELEDIQEQEEEGEESLPTPDTSGEYECHPKEPIGPRQGARNAAGEDAALMVRTFDAPFYLNGLSEIHLVRFQHLRPNLLNHLRYGSVSILPQTTYFVFRQFPTMANNVYG